MLGAARCCGPLGAGMGTVRQAAGAAPPDGVAPVVVPVAVLLALAVLELVLGEVELWLALLPQPAAPRAMTRARQALRIAPKKTRSAHCELLEPWKLKPPPRPLLLPMPPPLLPLLTPP